MADGVPYSYAVTTEGLTTIHASEGFTQLFPGGEGDGMAEANRQAVLPCFFWASRLIPVDQLGFFDALASNLLTTGGPERVSMVGKCVDGTGKVFLALIRYQLMMREGGREAMEAFSCQRLPASPYVLQSSEEEEEEEGEDEDEKKEGRAKREGGEEWQVVLPALEGSEGGGGGGENGGGGGGGEGGGGGGGGGGKGVSSRLLFCKVEEDTKSGMGKGKREEVERKRQQKIEVIEKARSEGGAEVVVRKMGSLSLELVVQMEEEGEEEREGGFGTKMSAVAGEALVGMEKDGGGEGRFRAPNRGGPAMV
jgi:hypothetical protein